MAAPVQQFQPVNAYGQIVAGELMRAAGEITRANRRTLVSGTIQEGSFGSLYAPERDRQYFAVCGAATSVPHVFNGTMEFLDTSTVQQAPAYQNLEACYVFPLPPTPDPNSGDQILGRYAGQLIVDGVERALIAYC
jgi:hypothetical protein